MASPPQQIGVLRLLVVVGTAQVRLCPPYGSDGSRSASDETIRPSSRKSTVPETANPASRAFCAVFKAALAPIRRQFFQRQINRPLAHLRTFRFGSECRRNDYQKPVAVPA